MEIALLRWPAEQDQRLTLAAEGRPRLLLIDGEQLAPAIDDCYEDWVRMPASQADIDARCRALLARVGSHFSVSSALSSENGNAARVNEVSLDEYGVLRRSGLWVSLPPVEARLMAALLDRVGAVVSRDQLARSGWPMGAPGRNALDVHMLRLRKRIAEIGLVIKTVRSRGYLLEPQSQYAAV